MRTKESVNLVNVKTCLVHQLLQRPNNNGSYEKMALYKDRESECIKLLISTS